MLSDYDRAALLSVLADGIRSRPRMFLWPAVWQVIYETEARRTAWYQLSASERNAIVLDAKREAKRDARS
jgi:hypothetical protein